MRRSGSNATFEARHFVRSRTTADAEDLRAGTRLKMRTEALGHDLYLFLGEPALEGFGIAGIHHVEWTCGCAAVSNDGDGHYALDVCCKHAGEFAPVK